MIPRHCSGGHLTLQLRKRESKSGNMQAQYSEHLGEHFVRMQAHTREPFATSDRKHLLLLGWLETSSFKGKTKTGLAWDAQDAGGTIEIVDKAWV